jgi:hypothetical protein
MVSAFIAKQGYSANVLDLALTVENMQLILSEPILKELQEVLKRNEVRERFSYTDHDIKQVVSRLRALAKRVPIRSRLAAIEEDPQDDAILTTAYSGKADYIVSGDRHLLILRTFKGIRIVNPRQMIKLISKKFPEFMLHF